MAPKRLRKASTERVRRTPSVSPLPECSTSSTEKSSRPKRGSHEHGPAHDAKLEAAISDVIGGMKIRSAAKKHGVPRTTLQDRLKGKSSKPVGRPTCLSATEERVLAEHLIVVADWGFPLTRLDLALLVKSYLDSRNVTQPMFKNNLPGDKWIRKFLRRHTDLSTRYARNISAARAKVSPDEVRKYFTNLQNTIADVPPANILNYDETNLSDDPGTKQAIFKRGTRYPELIMTQSKSAVSVMFAGTASGEVLPPYVVYKSKHLYDTWTRNGPVNTVYNRSKSGWFDIITFTDWFKTLVLVWARSKEGPKAIIGDNLSSHFSAEVIQLCAEHNIKFVCLPPNATHILQPLDVAFFRPLKIQWRQVLSEWKVKDRNRHLTIPKDVFPYLLKKLMEAVSPHSANNLKSAFKATGISPLCADVVLNKIPGGVLSPSREEIQARVSTALLSHLKDQRYGSDDAPKRGRKRRLQVSPGKSIQNPPPPEPAGEEESEDEEEADQPQPLDSDDEFNDSIPNIEPVEGAVLSVTVEVTPKEAVVTVGQNVSMLCRVSVPIQYCRFEVPGLAASLNLNPLRSPSPPSYAAYLGDGLDKGHCGITIPRVEDLYNGPFKCAVGVATEGHESFATMQVIVARAPKLPPHMEVTRSRDPQDSYHEGERIQASCIVPDGRPVANITWFMGEDMLTEEVQRPEVIENPKDNLFTIIQNLTRTVRWSDNGKELRCVANHPVIGSDTTRTTARKRINVKFSPKPSDSDLEQFGFIEGEEGVITVRIKANPKPSFVWTVGNENIDEGNVDNSGHYEVGFAEAKDAGEWETKLHIRQVNKEDVEREYRIQATNSIGQQDYVVRISTSSQPRAMAEMGAGAIIGIVVAVLLVVLIIFIVVFARATGRWCFAGGAASRHTGETGGDPEDPGKREEAKRLTSKSRISTSVNNEQLLSQSSDTESADQGPAQKKQNIIKKKMPLVDFFKKAKDKVAGDTEILKDADAEKVAQQATHAVPEGEPKEVVYAELTHEQQVNQPTGVRVPVDKTEYSEILPINKDGKKPEK